MDGVGVASPANHWITYFTQYNPGFTSEIRVPVPLGAMPMSARKIAARRGLLEVVPNQGASACPMASSRWRRRSTSSAT